MIGTSASATGRQLAALEEPADAIVVDGAVPPEAIVTTIVERLGLPLPCTEAFS